MKLKRVIIMLAAVMLAACAFADGIVRNVTMRKLEPWNGLVEISYELTRDAVAPEGRVLSTRVTVRDKSQSRNYLARTFTTSPTYNAGKHRLVWNAAMDGVSFYSENVTCIVDILCTVPHPPLYCVISLSTDTAPGSYTVSYLSDVPEGGWTDEYKTTKLVLRRIEPGTVPTRDCRISKEYWIGVFEVTQRQWELVMGTRPSYFSNDSYYQTRPVESISYDMIRGSFAGSGWPSSPDVDEESFIYRIRERSGLENLDLPTEAQWEYACRSGTSTDYNDGTNCEYPYDVYGSYRNSTMDNVGRNGNNSGSSFSYLCDPSSGTAKVGSYMPNAWGLYDMHGNVEEWCLDWYDMNCDQLTGDDQVGVASGNDRVVRGGIWNGDPCYCTSSCRSHEAPSFGSFSSGFRLVLSSEL